MANVSSFSGAMPVIPGGEVEIARVTRTDGGGGVAAVGTTWATGSNFFSTSLTFVADGASTYALEFFAPLVYSPTLANQLALRISASDGTSDGGIISFAGNAAAEGQSVFSRVFVAPSAGTATYNVRFGASTSVGQIYCGVGGVGAYVPAYLRAVKIVNQNDGLKPVWTPPIVTQLPTQATFGDAVLFAADATNGVYWHLSYDGLGTYPWKFIGGSGVTTTTTAYPASSYPSSFTSLNSGPAWMPPLAGDYNVRHWGRLDIYGPTAERIVEICPATNTVAASSSYATAVGNWVTSGAVYRSAWTGERLMQGMLSTEYLTIKAQYGVGVVTFVPFYCGMTATPIRVKAA